MHQPAFPTLKPGDILFMDNLSPHNAARLDQLIRSCGTHLIRLPPYSSEFNPIELTWSKVKTILQILAKQIIVDPHGKIVDHELNSSFMYLRSLVQNLSTPGSGEGSSEHVRSGVLFTNQIPLSCSLRKLQNRN